MLSEKPAEEVLQPKGTKIKDRPRIGTGYRQKVTQKRSPQVQL